MRKVWLMLFILMVLLLAACGDKDKEDKSSNQPPTNTGGTNNSDGGEQSSSDGTLEPTATRGMPPTWTASPAGFRASLTPTPTTAADSAQSSSDATSVFPPTWTASPSGFRASLTPTGQAAPDSNGGASGAAGDAGSSESSGGASGAATSIFPPTWTPVPSRTPGQRPTSSGIDPLMPTPLPAGPTWTPQPAFCKELAEGSNNPGTYVGQPFVVNWIPVSWAAAYLVEVRHPGGGVVVSETVLTGSFTVPGEIFTQANVYSWQVTPLDETGNPLCYPISNEIVVTFDTGS